MISYQLNFCTFQSSNRSLAEEMAFCLSPLQKPGMDVADGYVTFVRHSQDMLREKVNEEVYIERLFDVSRPECCCHNLALLV